MNGLPEGAQFGTFPDPDWYTVEILDRSFPETPLRCNGSAEAVAAWLRVVANQLDPPNKVINWSALGNLGVSSKDIEEWKKLRDLDA